MAVVEGLRFGGSGLSHAVRASQGNDPHFLMQATPHPGRAEVQVSGLRK